MNKGKGQEYEQELNKWKQAHSDLFYKLALSRNDLLEAKEEIQKLKIQNNNLQKDLYDLEKSFHELEADSRYY